MKKRMRIEMDLSSSLNESYGAYGVDKSVYVVFGVRKIVLSKRVPSHKILENGS